MNIGEELSFREGTCQDNELHYIPFDCDLNDNVYLKERQESDNKSFNCDSEEYLSGEDINSEFIYTEEPTNSFDNEQLLTDALDSLELSEMNSNKDKNLKKISAIETYADTDESSHEDVDGWLEKDETEVDIANVDKSINLSDQETDETKPKMDTSINKRDPAFRPRKGWFFQHDTRDEDISDDAMDDNSSILRSKKRISNEGNLKTKMDGRWTHDLFDEYEQSPKTPEEILLHYGHDIRDEDTTGNSTFNRRGQKFRRNIPKYNRDWQDADAYNKKRYPPHQAYNQQDEKGMIPSKSPPRKVIEDRGISKSQKTSYNESSSPSRFNRYRDRNDENKPPPPNHRTSRMMAGNDYKSDPHKFQHTGSRAKHNSSESSFTGREGDEGRREDDTKRYSRSRQSFPPQREDQNNRAPPPGRILYDSNRGVRGKENVGGPLKDNNYNSGDNYHHRLSNSNNRAFQQQHQNVQRGGGSAYLREISPNPSNNYKGKGYAPRNSPPKRWSEETTMQAQRSGHTPSGLGGTKAYTKSRKPLHQEEQHAAGRQQNEKYVGKSYEQGSGGNKMNSQQPVYAQPLMSLQDGHALPSKAPQNLFVSSSAFLTQNLQPSGLMNPMFYPPIQQVLMQRNNLNNIPPYAPANMSHNSFPYLRLAGNGGNLSSLYPPQLSQGLFANPYFSSGNLNFQKSPLKMQNTLADEARPNNSTTFYNNEGLPTADQLHYLENNAPFDDSLDVSNATFPYPLYSPYSYVTLQAHLQNFGLQDPSLLQNAPNTILNSYPNFYGIESDVMGNDNFPGNKVATNDELQQLPFSSQSSDIKPNNFNTVGKIKLHQ